jgi:hypothetical protein
MGFGDSLLLKKLGLGVLTFTGILTALLGGWILLSAFSHDPELWENQAGVTDNSLDRRPSSLQMLVEPRSPDAVTPEAKIETIKLGCIKDGSQIQVKSLAKQLRLKGSLCNGGLPSLKESSVINRANGFVATLFSLNSGTFTSDYISLDEGTNHLMLSIDNDQGKHSMAEVTVSRERD